MSLSTIYGPIYFGTILTTAFYGVTCMQTFFYYVHYQKDPWYLKSLVAVTWALNSIHEALTVAGTYKYFMAGLVNPLAILDEPVDLVVQILPTNLCAVIMQGFLVYRLYTFSKKNIIAPIAWLILGLGQIVTVAVFLGMALSSSNGQVQVLALPQLDKPVLTTLSTTCLSIAAAEDILIAIFMTFLLVRERGTSRFTKTTHILQRLTVFAVNTGTWSATFALLSTILMHALSSSPNFIYAAFLIPLCPVYCNTLLANLNARSYIVSHEERSDYFSSSTLPTSETHELHKPAGGSVWSAVQQKVFGNREKVTTLTPAC